MDLQQRIDLMVRLGEYMAGNEASWQAAKEQAYLKNPWFIPEFIEKATASVQRRFLQRQALEAWAARYAPAPAEPKNVGLVLAGNIPLVGFHDFLCVFISGHQATIKASAKDEVLIKHLVRKLYEWEIVVQNYVSFAETLKGCDAYIATGSNNTGRYFEYYFGRYPHIIRKNRTSVAVLDGTETGEELTALASDMLTYFGLGCRNVTKLYVPEGYDFVPLLRAVEPYERFEDFHKFKNNYDYQLALLIMNGRQYMTNKAIILTERSDLFTPVSQVNFEYYTDAGALLASLRANPDVQVVVGHQGLPFGQTQEPGLDDYADGVDTMAFLTKL